MDPITIITLIATLLPGLIEIIKVIVASFGG